MIALDKLFRMLLEHDMDVLLIEPGVPPGLLKDGRRQPAAKTRLDGSLIHKLLNEIPEAQLDAVGVSGEMRRFSYQCDGRGLSLEATWGEEGWSARVTPAERQARPAPTAPRQSSGDAGSPLGGLDALLEMMLARGASDLHLCSGQTPRLRVHGDLEKIEGFGKPDSAELERMLLPVTPQPARERFAETNDADFAYELSGKSRFRVNVFRDHRGTGVVIREIPFEIPSFEQLELPESLREIADLTKGLVLVTGPTGSGKSTTLAALVDLINRSRADHIITIEDPVEFVHPSRRCLVNQREVGTHTASFAQALRAALREDPDIVLVGEMRDLETTSTAIETAETGHLVFGTLHTTTAASTVERLIDQFPADRQGQIRTMLAQSLHAVVAQMLLKKVGGGRVAAFEVLIATPAVANLIREGKTFQLASAMQTGRAQGMVLLNDSLLALVKSGQVEAGEAYLKAVNKSDLRARFEAERIVFNPRESTNESIPKQAARRTVSVA
jgi:twitching motility protein PilT